MIGDDSNDITSPKVENPEVFPRYVYMHQRKEDDVYDSYNKRGGRFFEGVADLGIRVEFVNLDDSWTYHYTPPWTVVFQPVPIQDMTSILVPPAHGLTVILDVPFPIARPEPIQGSEASLKQIVDNMDTMLHNLKMACAVTTPHKEWAVDLADKGIPAWYLPDISDMYSQESVTAFTVKWIELAATTMRACVPPPANAPQHLEH